MLKILLIDDEEDFCFFIKGNLEQSGRFTVYTADNGELGLEMAREYKPDLVLLDLVMPDMSGDEVAGWFEHDPDLSHIPIIFLTAIVTKEETGDSNYKQIGGRYFVAKPISTKDLIEAIEDRLQWHTE
ncbi:response regulator [Desulfovermiculus halophilus]|jgi:CheY-like chemotaxis protein|uniref:response regulator n=1 Tax=Desulfovermiculus halophilus TaxID=339722 RepID=UPI000483E60E|nr:response regulator [Desulfovermiculus halophilus]